MTPIIDDQSDPGAYADKFKDAPFYGQPIDWRGFQHLRKEWAKSARCYRDRKAHDKLIATTNAIRAKHGMEPL